MGLSRIEAAFAAPHLRGLQAKVPGPALQHFSAPLGESVLRAGRAQLLLVMDVSLPEKQVASNLWRRSSQLQQLNRTIMAISNFHETCVMY